ncbi:N2227-domain-containing protein [Phlegmacium glaucopus]|nr:N2227-domain-containing protein [Phlegmacium glaucopus]
MESDAFLACFFPLAILLLCFKLFPKTTLSEIRDLLSLRQHNPSRNSYFSLERAYHSYSQYVRLSANELSLMRASNHTLHHSNKNLNYNIGYPKKLNQLRYVTTLNETITEGIVQLAREEFPSLAYQSNANMVSADLVRVRESLKHFIRDWSEEGAGERTRTFSPILDVLKEVDPSQRGEMKVLVPGCGLGRLAWEIAQLGFDTTANELSFFMTLAMRFLFSPKATKSVNEHGLYPYAHWFSHQKSSDSLFRRLPFPDVTPRFTPNFHLVEQDFLTLPVPSSSEGYDFIITLFFIDTSLDVFATMRHIHKLLRPGGLWINLGPLLWTGGAQAKVELSLDEVLLAAEEIGFVLQKQGAAARRTVECEYTSDSNAMMRWVYLAEFWVARK